MKYRTVVVDPPWDYGGRALGGHTSGEPVQESKPFPYPTMSVEEIAALPIPSLAEEHAWLFMWATGRYLHAAFDLIEDFGFRYRQTLVWVKRGAPPFGGTFTHNTVEFLLGASKGSPPLLGRWAAGTVIETGRAGPGKHSQKPEVWLDFIETVVPGPYLELFARRNRLGWDTWGNEAIEHVQLTTGRNP